MNTGPPTTEGLFTLSPHATGRLPQSVTPGEPGAAVKPSLLNRLACPQCSCDLECEVFESADDEIVDGRLACSDCGSEFPIHRGVPRMVVSPRYSHPDYVARSEQAKRSGDARPIPDHGDASREGGLLAVKQATATSFGYEWQEYARFGWDARRPGETDQSRQAIEAETFAVKALVDPGELHDKLVLDAGCGNGRYLRAASESAGEVIGVDISGAVDVAYQNVGRHPCVHVIQADLFQLPFRTDTFDRIFSIGVLMHTGDARRAFDELAARLKPGGAISVHVYRRGNRIYEFLDDRIRQRTTRMELDRLLGLSKRVEIVPKALWATRHITLGRPILYQLLNCFVRLEFGEHYIFDWYSAPVASHHTYPEVHGWFCSAGLDVTDDHFRPKSLPVRILKPTAGAVTVKGVLPARL
jgi:SAM-dependent methyltransferase/uncharacterized protein YbaR (Trm112 family)